MRVVHTFSARRTFGGLVLMLVGLTLACRPSATATPTPVAADAFAVVRATSQAAYQAGQDWLDRGDIVQGCPLIDAANTADPDQRAEIQQALARCLSAIAAITPLPTATPGQHPIVIVTLPPLPAGAAAAALPGTLAPSSAATQPPLPTRASANATVKSGSTAAGPAGTPVTSGASATSVASASGASASASAQAGPPLTLIAWRDPQGRFSLSAPADWTNLAQPAALFGPSVVQFSDPTGRAELNVAVDNNGRAVSPELYAASLELAMQQQVPGYAGEQFAPGSTAGQPSVRRVFTFTQHDVAGKDVQARSFQVTVLKGSTPYIISGSSPAEQFQQYVPIFDQMVETFRFS